MPTNVFSVSDAAVVSADDHQLTGMGSDIKEVLVQRRRRQEPAFATGRIQKLMAPDDRVFGLVRVQFDQLPRELHGLVGSSLLFD